MIANGLIDRLNQSMTWLRERQWSEWEVLTIAITALFVLVWMTRRQRKRAVRNTYENQFLEGSPVIGMNLGVHRRSRRAIKDLKKARLAALQKRHLMQQKHTEQAEPTEKLHEQIRELQREIIKRKQVEVRLEQQVAELTAARDKLQRELDGKKQSEQESKKQTAEEITAEQLLQPEISEEKKVEQDIKEPVTEVSTEITLPKEKPAGGVSKFEKLHRVVDGIEQKLCRKCGQWKTESEFHKNSSSKDGLAGSCKTCKAKAAREYRKRRKAAES